MLIYSTDLKVYSCFCASEQSNKVCVRVTGLAACSVPASPSPQWETLQVPHWSSAEPQFWLIDASDGCGKIDIKKSFPRRFKGFGGHLIFAVLYRGRHGCPWSLSEFSGWMKSLKLRTLQRSNTVAEGFGCQRCCEFWIVFKFHHIVLLGLL